MMQFNFSVPILNVHILQAKQRCYHHRARQFIIENDVIDILKQMNPDSDGKFVEILLIGFIGKAKIKMDEIDRDALDLITSSYHFIYTLCIQRIFVLVFDIQWPHFLFYRHFQDSDWFK